MRAFTERRTNRWRAVAWTAGVGTLAGVAFIVLHHHEHGPQTGAKTGGSAAQPADPGPNPNARVPPLAPDHPRFRPKPNPTAMARPSPPTLPGDAGDDGKATALLRLANDALEREDYAEALRDAQGCLEIDPADHDCFDDELMVYGRTGDFANERILAEECLFDDPDDVGCLESIVVLNARDRDFAAARVAADHLRQLAPNTTSSAIADATIADLSGDLSAALADYERACTLGQEFACFRAQAIRNGAR